MYRIYYDKVFLLGSMKAQPVQAKGLYYLQSLCQEICPLKSIEKLCISLIVKGYLLFYVAPFECWKIYVVLVSEQTCSRTATIFLVDILRI